MFTYKWNLKDLEKVEKNGYTVFSCFAGGGGSSQGYKMAGYEVIGCNEIDPRQMEIYKHNLKPKYSYLEDIRTFRLRDDLPKELFELDILDASFPCSLFSTSNTRADDKKGKEVKFREGQATQTLDDLAFETIKLVDKIKPKICVFENVKGLLQEKNKWYVQQIYKQFESIGYKICHYLKDCADFGVPQRRKRVFFFAVRNDINVPTGDIFGCEPMLNINYMDKHIPYKEIEEYNMKDGTVKVYPTALKWWKLTKPGKYFADACELETGSRNYMDYLKIDKNKVLGTITAHVNGGGSYHYDIPRTLTDLEIRKASSFPLDYNFLEENPKYVCGMSVPPLAMYRISKEIQIQWLDKNVH